MPTETTANYPRYDAERLKWFSRAVFERLGVRPGDAAVAAEILVASDLRGIESHGMPRLRAYLDRIAAGAINLEATPTIDRETAVTAAVDGHNGIGLSVAHWAMDLCVRKAQASGLAFVTVRRSNHFGIAGYYATMALERGLIGLAATNAAPLMVPPHARRPLLGTNPVAMAVPAGKERPFVLDIALTTVAWGKVEIARREEHPIPLGWALDEHGNPTEDPAAALKGTLLPVGGPKGYGMSVVLDIISGVLSGATFGKGLGGPGGGHFFQATDVEAFMPLDEFKKLMGDLVDQIKNSQLAPGSSGIFLPGEIEYTLKQQRLREGIPMTAVVVEEINQTARELGSSQQATPQ